MSTNQVRLLLNTVFIIGAIASLICYYTVDDRHVFLYVCSASIFVKLIEFIVRYLM